MCCVNVFVRRCSCIPQNPLSPTSLPRTTGSSSLTRSSGSWMTPMSTGSPSIRYSGVWFVCWVVCPYGLVCSRYPSTSSLSCRRTSYLTDCCSIISQWSGKSGQVRSGQGDLQVKQHRLVSRAQQGYKITPLEWAS